MSKNSATNASMCLEKKKDPPPSLLYCMISHALHYDATSKMGDDRDTETHFMRTHLT